MKLYILQAAHRLVHRHQCRSWASAARVHAQQCVCHQTPPWFTVLGLSSKDAAGSGSSVACGASHPHLVVVGSSGLGLHALYILDLVREHC